MKVYLVGGAVRDKLLGRKVHDADYVVVGCTVAEMLQQGFTQVGADFPVFLHPHTKQEYALARTERKSGQGYSGFEVHASPDVTLEEDLIRRDLTINAMAIEVNGLYDDNEKTGDIIDPYNGFIDIENKILRHVSPAFLEDPLRVLRVARFYARYYKLNNKNSENHISGFTIAPETFAVMKTMVANDELNHLSRERIWTESERATLGEYPHIYWQTLFELEALTLFPPLQSHWRQNSQDKQLTLNALSIASKFNLSIEQRWALIMSQLTQEQIEQVHKSNTIPKKNTSFANLYIKNAKKLARISTLEPTELMNLLQDSNSHKQPEQFSKLYLVYQVLETAKAQMIMDTTLESYQSITIKDIDSNLTGKAIGEALGKARISALAKQLPN